MTSDNEIQATCDLAIIGGGAAGLAAGIFAGETATTGKRILILDGAKSLGAKILVSGGGRCNVTHEQVRTEDFNGSRNIVRNILAAFDATAAVRWFADMGVELKQEDTGKLFPVTDSARTVLDALLRRYRDVGGIVRCNTRVLAITNSEANTFRISHVDGVIEARRIVMATGGRSLPRSGSDGSGWDVVRGLGHTVTPTYAALAPLVMDARMFHASLAGISQIVELSTFVGGKRIDHRAGSLLWTHFGASGPVVMDASRHWVVARETGAEPEMRCNLLPGETFETTERWLIETRHGETEAGDRECAVCPIAGAHVSVALRGSPRRSTASYSVRGNCPARFAVRWFTRLTALVLPVVGHRGWNYAEVTAGGVPLAEIDYRTMESRKVRGLYLAGRDSGL